MNALSIRSGDNSWRFLPLPPARETDLLRTIARATVVDDVTLLPPAVALAVRAAERPWQGRAGPDGLVGLIGRPSQAGPPAALPMLPVAMVVAAPGYAELALAGVLPAQPPNDFLSLDWGVRRLRRLATVIEGRVLRFVGGVPEPVAGAVVTVTAATPVPALAGALPAPAAVGGWVGLAAAADGHGFYRFPELARFATVTLRVTAPAASAPVTLAPVFADSRINQDFHLP